MRDVDTAERLGIDTSQMVNVTHPAKLGRDGRPRVFTMPRLAYEKRNLAEQGFVIGTQANGRIDPRDAENEKLRARIAQLEADQSDSSGEGLADKLHDAVQRDDIELKADSADSERDALLAEARELGFNPRSNIKLDRLRQMVEDGRAKQAETDG